MSLSNPTLSSFRCAVSLLAICACVSLLASSTAVASDEHSLAPKTGEVGPVAEAEFSTAVDSEGDPVLDLLRRDAVAIVPSAKGDPMFRPFIIGHAITEQALARMNSAFEAGRIEESVALARYLTVNFPDSEEAKSARLLLEAQTCLVETGTDGEPCESILPAFVATNTKAIITGPDRALIVVGDEFLREGDAVPGYPSVTVAAIRRGEVEYRVTSGDRTSAYTVRVYAP